MRKFIIYAVAMATMGATSAHAMGCSKPKFTKQEMQVISPDRLNQKLFSSAATKVTNYYRCRAGKPKLKEIHGLRQAAADHSRKMARTGGNKARHYGSLKPRYRKEGIKAKVMAENVGLDARLNYGRTPFIARNSQSCAYVFHDSKSPIPQHSYASLATRMVALWVKSPGHKQNIMHPRIRKIGNGIGYSRRTSQPCGGYYLTQNLAD
ncbi:hypothetical protein BFP76_04735 [Amylibacter kogurei]|uniref:SCP domain-containing protein n=1 Tax=Paramylibacter kogurei TaxID=1889778 RepID=A0A2G5K4P9_9RHOB|nr:CAP domain-containing protein [Amylibacter kogurei]PIB24511.1 hypothetical protein BFP76_04735 [Amylibacter kogurei]